MIRNFTKSILALFLLLTVATACKEEETPMAQILAGFTSTSLGLTLDDTDGTVAVEISRTDASATVITLNVTEDAGTVYGEDYTTTPAAENGVISLDIAAGETSADLVVNKLKNPEFDEVKGFDVTIAEVSNGGKAGTNSQLRVTFEENPVSSGAEILAEVGGPTQPSQVFIDLSKQFTASAEKASWDLGFNTGIDNRVIINYATYALVKPTDQSDLANVTDVIVTEEFKADMTTVQVNTQYMDDTSGDLTKTSIDEVKSTDNDNLVYVLNRGYLDDSEGTQRGFIKFKITLTDNDYVVTYGEINDVDNFSSLTISRDTDYNFIFFSFDDGIVTVEPEKTNWDFAMTTSITAFFNPGDNQFYTYAFKDYSITNKGNTKISRVAVTDMVTYEAFSYADISGLTLEDNRTGIGSSWRTTFPELSLKTDIFYVIEDTDGNYYKLKFTDLVNESAERGYPKFIYELLTE